MSETSFRKCMIKEKSFDKYIFYIFSFSVKHDKISSDELIGKLLRNFV